MISTSYINSPVGPLFLGANEEGVVFLEFASGSDKTARVASLKKKLKDKFVEGDSPHLDELKRQLSLYFEGKLNKFDLPLKLTGTEFQKKVWKALLDIPFGETRSYAEQAKAIGKLSAVRAVANANGDNLISIVIPCHRVIGSNGSLTGYGGGIDNKKWLLDHEKLQNTNPSAAD